MAWLLDTSVAIRLRDGDVAVTDRVAALGGAVLMSIVTRVDLEGGVYREPAHAAVRRARLDTMLAAIPRWPSTTRRPMRAPVSSPTPATRAGSSSTA
jgi:predicted nucleic acid-binding protein